MGCVRHDPPLSWYVHINEGSPFELCATCKMLTTWSSLDIGANVGAIPAQLIMEPSDEVDPSVMALLWYRKINTSLPLAHAVSVADVQPLSVGLAVVRLM